MLHWGLIGRRILEFKKELFQCPAIECLCVTMFLCVVAQMPVTAASLDAYPAECLSDHMIINPIHFWRVRLYSSHL